MFSVSVQIKKVRVIIDYQGRQFILEVPPYKTICFLKEQARRHFLPINKNAILMHQNKDMSNVENSLVGDYFKNRSAIPFKLVLTQGTPSIENKSTCFIKSPTVNHHKCSCEKGNVEYYCRQCKEFICCNCHTSSHEKHLTIQLNAANPMENVKYYAMTFQDEIKSTLNSTKTYSLEFQRRNLIDITSRQEMFLRKLQKVHSLYKEMMAELTSLHKEEMKMEEIIENFSTNAQITSEEIDNLLSSISLQYKRGRGRMTYKEMTELFKEINQKERTFGDISSNALAHKVNYEVNAAIDAMYSSIEKVVDDYLDSKTPLGIDPKICYLFELIKKKRIEMEKIKGENNQRAVPLKQSIPKSLEIKGREVIHAKDTEKREDQMLFDDANKMPLLTSNNDLIEEPSLKSNKCVVDNDIRGK